MPNIIDVKIKQMRDGRHPLPFYATEDSAGLDFYAYLDKGPVRLFKGDRALIPLGVAMNIPKGKVLLLTPRSGLALKKGITLTNAPGVIDADFIGELGAIVQNLGDEMVVISDGERIAQGEFYDYYKAKFIEVDELDETERGASGFGHSGV